MGKAWHNDEPFFLAAARQVLRDPLHPLDFRFVWFGRSLPAAQINTTPPVLLYLASLALKLTGGGEWAMRLAFLPLDLLAALSLYLLAARFLSRPLLPVLIVIASPAYLINMNHLMPEKPAAAFGFCGLYALVRAADEKRSSWLRAASLLVGAAVMSKYLAVLFLLPALGYGLERGVPRRRLAAACALALAPAAAHFLYEALFNPDVLRRAWDVTAESSSSWWSGGAHKLRSLLAFTGGCGVVTAFWPLLVERRARVLAGALSAAVILFLPAFDLVPVVQAVDRSTGLLLSAGALVGLCWLLGPEARGQRGWPLWAPWAVAVLVIEGCLYWSVMSRIILFLLPPFVFAMAERIEARPWAGRLYGASLCGALALSLSLAVVDYRYAAAQKEFAGKLESEYIARGRKVWYTGYMGLQYYLDKAGASGLDASRGGWDLAKPGDAVAVLKINTAHLRPGKPVKADMRSYVVDHPIPLRLISGWTGEGGFYSNVWGFLPYSLSREPLEEFTVVEVR